MKSQEHYDAFKAASPAVFAAAEAAGIKLGEQLSLDESEFFSSDLEFLAEHPDPPRCAACLKEINEEVPVWLWKNKGAMGAVLHAKCAERRFKI